MRALEALLVGSLALACLVRVVHPDRWRPFGAAVLIAVAAAGSQLALERYRWQLLPAYFAVLALVALALRLRSAAAAEVGGAPAWRRALTAGAIGLLLVASVAIPVLFPHLRLPRPTGPHAVGTRDVHLVDPDRPETFTPAPRDRREVWARIWYPAAEGTRGAPVSYGEHAREIGRAFARYSPMPPFLLDSLELVPTHSVRGAELSRTPAQLALVVFSHAYWGAVPQNTVLMEELASHGYAALSVGHAHETSYFVDPDGRVRPFDPAGDEFRLRGAERSRALPVERRIAETTDAGELERLLREYARRRPKTLESVGIWVEDIRFLLDALGRDGAGLGELAGRIDTRRVGLMGHSFGGAVAGEFCVVDARCAAGINLDGLQLGRMLDEPVARPFMFVHHDNRAVANPLPNRLFYERAAGPAYLALVRGSRHMSFSDLPLYGAGSLVRLAGTVGDISRRRMLALQGELVRSFFDRHLRGGDPSRLESLPARFPEIELQSRRP